MSRIFTTLTIVGVACLVATLLLGFSLRSVDIRDPADHTAQRWATTHRLAGIATGIIVVLVQSIVVTYFVGTSRWCKEVVDTYSLDEEYKRRTAAIKRRTFPYAVLCMLTVVGIIALGGAADPAGTVKAAAPAGLSWANIHFLGAGLGIAFILYASLVEGFNIAANHRAINEILADVARIRRERGLDVA